MFKKPSELHACLTDERIDHIGHLIARARAENLDSAEHRDNAWSIGCRAHAWMCSEIMAEAEMLPWLDIVDPSLRFIAAIGNVPFSFYKEIAGKPKNNIYSRVQSYPELRQNNLLFDLPIPEKLEWFYAVETDLEGVTTNIEFFGMSESGEIVSSRTIPLHNDYTNIIAINTHDSEPADLPAAPVSLPKTKKDKATNSEEPK